MKELELLAPAGSYDGLVAAINAGADAVYIGGQKFGARAYAENPEEELLLRGIEYAHLRDKKVYLTVNTLLKNQELRELYDYLKPAYEAGLDAVIVQDLGVMSYIRRQFPYLDIHASTQMGITGADGFSWLEEQGVTRVVPARELSLKELKHIHENTSLEIEAFIHGALCYCYSGQCLLSSIIGGRSGNRGRCAQPCRLPYSAGSKPAYLLSPKDLCTIDLIQEMVEAGVFSFKIEGRMKRPEYAAGVVEIYRKALDKKVITKADRTQLMNLYSRSGNCSGYLKNHNGKSMITIDSPGYRTGEESLFKRIHTDYLDTKHSIPVNGSCSLALGRDSVIKLQCGEKTVTVTGDSPEPAKKQPLDEDSLRKRLSKTGETDFKFESLDIEMEDGLFMPVQSLNILRRGGLDLLKEKLLENSRRTAPEKDELMFYPKNKNSGNYTEKSFLTPAFNVLVTSLEQAKVTADFSQLQDIYIDTAAFWAKGDYNKYYNALTALKNAGKRIFIALPHIFRANTKKLFFEAFDKIFTDEIDGCLIRNWESYVFIKEMLNKHPGLNLALRSDSSIYCFNDLSLRFLKEAGFEKITLPVELNRKELEMLADKSCEWIIYSHLPLMVSAQCIQNTTAGCSRRPEILYIKDRRKKTFPVRNYCDCCYNIIYNGTPMILWDKEIPAGSFRLDFHLESAEETKEILKNAITAFSTKQAPEGDFTRGHFNRGVE